MITIGNDYGGPEHLDRECAIVKVLSNAMNIAADLRSDHYDDGAAPWINLVFIVPGSVSKPDFQGLRLGHFSRKKKGLVVMIAVPGTVALGERISEFVIDSLRKAAQIAASTFKSKGIQFSLEDAENFIARLERRLIAFSNTVH